MLAKVCNALVRDLVSFQASRAVRRRFGPLVLTPPPERRTSDDLIRVERACQNTALAALPPPVIHLPPLGKSHEIHMCPKHLNGLDFAPEIFPEI